MKLSNILVPLLGPRPEAEMERSREPAAPSYFYLHIGAALLLLWLAACLEGVEAFYRFCGLIP